MTILENHFRPLPPGLGLEPVRSAKFMDVEVWGHIFAESGTIGGDVTILGTVTVEDIVSDDWDGGSDLSGGRDGTATLGYFLDDSAGAAQFLKIYAVGGEIGNLDIVSSLTLDASAYIQADSYSNPSEGETNLRLSSDGLYMEQGGNITMTDITTNYYGFTYTDSMSGGSPADQGGGFGLYMDTTPARSISDPDYSDFGSAFVWIDGQAAKQGDLDQEGFFLIGNGGLTIENELRVGGSTVEFFRNGAITVANTTSGEYVIDQQVNNNLILRNTGGGDIYIQTNNGSNRNRIFIDQSTDRIQFGDVSGTRMWIMDSPGGESQLIPYDNTGNFYDSYLAYNDGALQWKLRISGTDEMILGTTGFVVPNVYNNTTGSAANVHVSVASGGTLQRVTSSKKYKNRITYNVGYLADIVLKPTKHWRIDDREWRYGLILEDLAAVDPLLVNDESPDWNAIVAVLIAKINRLEGMLGVA